VARCGVGENEWDVGESVGNLIESSELDAEVNEACREAELAAWESRRRGRRRRKREEGGGY